MQRLEKHIGAAWVLIAEHRHGHPHRLCAVGDLHEAEDESQAWPELNNAIEVAPKAYQQTGAIPAFAALAAMAGEIRNGVYPGMAPS